MLAPRGACPDSESALLVIRTGQTFRFVSSGVFHLVQRSEAFEPRSQFSNQQLSTYPHLIRDEDRRSSNHYVHPCDGRTPVDTDNLTPPNSRFLWSDCLEGSKEPAELLYLAFPTLARPLKTLQW